MFFNHCKYTDILSFHSSYLLRTVLYMYFNPFSVASLLDKNIFQLSEKPWKSLFELKLKSKSKVKLNFRGKKLTIFFHHGFIFREMVLNDSLVPKEGEFA